MKTVRLQTVGRNRQAARQAATALPSTIRKRKESIGAASLQEMRKGAVEATLRQHSPAAAEEHDEKKTQLRPKKGERI